MANAVHGSGRLRAGRAVQALAQLPREHRLLRGAVQRDQLRHPLPQRGEPAEARHLCGEPHLTHRRAGAHVRQLLLAGTFYLSCSFNQIKACIKFL